VVRVESSEQAKQLQIKRKGAPESLSHPLGKVVHVQAVPRRHQEDVTEMKHQEPLRISCDGCTGGCDDCLVEFFMAERDAQVVRLGGGEPASGTTAPAPAPTSRQRLDPELQRVFGALEAAGLRPELVAVRANRGRVSRAS
jgi:hypothetical protein